MAEVIICNTDGYNETKTLKSTAMDVVKHLFYPLLSFNPTYWTVTHSLPLTGSNWVQIGSF